MEQQMPLRRLLNYSRLSFRYKYSAIGHQLTQVLPLLVDIDLSVVIKLDCGRIPQSSLSGY
jgi:hypothetical protein